MQSGSRFWPSPATRFRPASRRPLCTSPQSSSLPYRSFPHPLSPSDLLWQASPSRAACQSTMVDLGVSITLQYYMWDRKRISNVNSCWHVPASGFRNAWKGNDCSENTYLLRPPDFINLCAPEAWRVRGKHLCNAAVSLTGSKAPTSPTIHENNSSVFIKSKFELHILSYRRVSVATTTKAALESTYRHDNPLWERVFAGGVIDLQRKTLHFRCVSSTDHVGRCGHSSALTLVLHDELLSSKKVKELAAHAVHVIYFHYALQPRPFISTTVLSSAGLSNFICVDRLQPASLPPQCCPVPDYPIWYVLITTAQIFLMPCVGYSRHGKDISRIPLHTNLDPNFSLLQPLFTYKL